jgi:hypothetical protein
MTAALYEYIVRRSTLFCWKLPISIPALCMFLYYIMRMSERTIMHIAEAWPGSSQHREKQDNTVLPYMRGCILELYCTFFWQQNKPPIMPRMTLNVF